MHSINGSYTSWSWRQNADIFSGSKWNTAAVTPERPCVPRPPLQQHLTRPNSANRCAALERRKARDEEKQEKALALSVRQGKDFCPQCGQLRGRELTLFWRGSRPIDADILKGISESRR